MGPGRLRVVVQVRWLVVGLIPVVDHSPCLSRGQPRDRSHQGRLVCFEQVGVAGPGISQQFQLGDRDVTGVSRLDRIGHVSHRAGQEHFPFRLPRSHPTPVDQKRRGRRIPVVLEVTGAVQVGDRPQPGQADTGQCLIVVDHPGHHRPGRLSRLIERVFAHTPEPTTPPTDRIQRVVCTSCDRIRVDSSFGGAREGIHATLFGPDTTSMNFGLTRPGPANVGVET